jgi:hypothetical protein
LLLILLLLLLLLEIHVVVFMLLMVYHQIHRPWHLLLVYSLFRATAQTLLAHGLQLLPLLDRTRNLLLLRSDVILFSATLILRTLQSVYSGDCNAFMTA